jgi:hypothetical protein
MSPGPIIGKKMISLSQNSMISSRGWNSGSGILPMVFLKRMAVVFIITLLLVTVSGCFMMPLHLAPLMNRTGEADVDLRVNAALSQLIQEAVRELVANGGPYEGILMGTAEVRNDFVPPEEFRQVLLETLSSSSEFQVFTQDATADSAPMGLENIGVIAMLDAQLYKAGDQIWLALQLLDVRSNRIFWSGIFSEPMPKTLDDLEEIDNSLTIGS